MTKIVLKFLLLLFVPFFAQARDTDSLRVLWVGNSYTYYNDMPSTVRQIAATQKVKLSCTRFLKGGERLSGHLKNQKLLDAIAAGEEGAISLHRFVQRATLTVGRNRRQFIELDKENALIPVNYDTTPRQRIGYNEALRRTFSDERVAFTEEQIKKETARCLSCGASIVDPNKCIGCGVCTTKCAFDAIHLHRERPECSKMYACEDKMKAILPYMIKREFKIKRAARKSK